MGLLWTTIKNQQHTHRHETHVTEKRAPTDESIRLLSEMEEKIERRMIDKWYVDNNILKLELAIVDNGLINQTLWGKMCINGKNFDFQKILMHSDRLPENIDKFINEWITSCIFQSGFSEFICYNRHTGMKRFSTEVNNASFP